MQGGVRKRGKTWSYYFYTGGNPRIVEKSGFERKKDAQDALRIAIEDFQHGYIAPKDMTFSVFASEWLESYVKSVRKVATYNRYKELTKKYLDSSIGHIPISEIQTYDVEKLLLDIRNKNNNLSNTTIQALYTLTNTIMNRALKLKVIKNNPCLYVERPKRDKFTPEVLNVDEINTMCNSLSLKNEYDYMFYIALKMTLELGLRRGELGGIEWENINFKNNIINIKNNLIYSNGHVLMSTPKTQESERELYISDELLNLLKDLKAKQLIDERRYNEFYQNNIFGGKEYNFIMKWSSGKYIHPSYYIHKLKKVVKNCKISKNVRFHDLRHTNATILLENGVDFKTIQTRLGHKDINTTLNIYSHVNKQMQKSATEKLLKAFNN